MKATGLIHLIRTILRILLTAAAGLVFLFSLFSGAGPGIMGVIRNFPNTLPWLGLLILTLITFYNEIIGGSLIIGLMMFLFFFFRVIPQDNWSAFFIFLLPLFLMGICFLVLGVFERRGRKQDGE